ncbi:hypothetical protein BT67DRAFT_157825 [Trichocladium antarcticum]|uniref:Uncharacterized protein n=1 Tax=Trichocladium antarcticum TaxID=1450529 RepID=A0AAN6UE42_9PEZI|nr:hypothetical protein BT67DRAFT_157825 [Trichocladium antarcticum]
MEENAKQPMKNKSRSKNGESARSHRLLLPEQGWGRGALAMGRRPLRRLGPLHPESACGPLGAWRSLSREVSLGERVSLCLQPLSYIAADPATAPYETH